MKAVMIEEFGEAPKVVEVDVPTVGENQILVKIAFSTINPSDLFSLKGLYPSGLTPPSVFGFEGSGVVEQVGENCLVPHKVGDRVSVLGRGIWSEYAVFSSEMAFPVFPQNSLQDAAAHFVNPATVVLMLDILKQSGSKAVIHDAGASSLGKMLIRLLKQEGIKSINLVRKNEYFEDLTNIGSDFNINLTSETFEADLSKIAHENEANVYFSAVAGDLTGKVLKAMPNYSTAYVYGGLSSNSVSCIGIDDLIFKGKQLKGLWLTPSFFKMTTEEKIKVFTTVQQNLNTIFKTEFTIFSPEQILEALEHSTKNSSNSKSLLKFSD